MMVSTPFSMRTISMKSGYLNLKVKTKYNNNPRINPIFKNAATDGYVSLFDSTKLSHFHWLFFGSNEELFYLFQNFP